MIFRRVGAQLWYVVISPLFFLIFVGAYKPHMAYNFLSMSRGLFDFNIVMLALILAGTIFVFRLLFYLIRNRLHMNWWYYIVWCVGEAVFASFFFALYLFLSNSGYTYALVLGKSAGLVFSVLPYPYVIISLALTNYSHKKYPTGRREGDSLIRFTDENKKLKLVISSESILYIRAEENYVRVHYLESDKIKEYLLRMTMKGIEPLMQRYGMIRCHRSYYINPVHVDVIRKDHDGNIFTQLDVASDVDIPVSRSHYEEVSKQL